MVQGASKNVKDMMHERDLYDERTCVVENPTRSTSIFSTSDGYSTSVKNSGDEQQGDLENEVSLKNFFRKVMHFSLKSVRGIQGKVEFYNYSLIVFDTTGIIHKPAYY